MTDKPISVDLHSLNLQDYVYLQTGGTKQIYTYVTLYAEDIKKIIAEHFGIDVEDVALHEFGMPSDPMYVKIRTVLNFEFGGKCDNKDDNEDGVKSDTQRWEAYGGL